MRTLMPHQETALAYCADRNHVALYLQMRLGKTLAYIRWVLACAEKGENAQFILVAAPLTVLRTWVNELQMEDEYCVLLSGQNAEGRQAILDYAFACGTRVWVLANYDTIRAMPSIAYLPWDFVCADESTILKNSAAKITQIFLDGFRSVPHRAILSGAFAPESLLDVFTQFQFLHGSFMSCYDYWTFRARYFVQSQRSWTVRRDKAMEIKAMIHRKAYVLSRDAAGVGSGKVYTERYVAPSDAQAKMNLAVMSEFAFQTEDGSYRETEYAIVRAMWLSRISGGHSPDGRLLSSTKAKEILYMLEDELKNEQVVIWFRFNDELQLIADILEEKGFTTGIVHGKTKPVDREINRQKFMDKKIQILLAQIKCAKYGLDCSIADTAIYYSNSYSCEERAQSEDRIVHPKKEKPVLYVDLVSEGCFDEEVVPKLQKKTFNSAWLMSRMNELQEAAFAHRQYRKINGVVEELGLRSLKPKDEEIENEEED